MPCGALVGVLDLPDVQVLVAHEIQQFHRVGGKVGLRRQHGVVVPPAQAVELPGIGVLVVLVAQHRHLLAGHVVQHLAHKPVAAVSGGVSAHHIGPPRRRRPVDLDGAARLLGPADVPDVYAVLCHVVLEQALRRRRPDPLQPLGHRLCVEHGFARHAPLPQTVDHVVILVRLLEGLQGLDGLLGQETVVLVGALMQPCPRVRLIEEPLFQPVCDADGVERYQDLQVVGEDRPQADVQLVEVSLLQFGRLLDPDARDVVDGFQLLHVVQAGEQDLAAVGEGDVHVAFIHPGAGVRVEVRDLAPQLLEATLPQRPRHLPAHQPAVPRLAGYALQDLPACEDAFSAAAAAFQNQVAVLIEEQGEEGFVVGLPDLLPPQGRRQQTINLLPIHPAALPPVKTPGTVPAVSPPAPPWVPPPRSVPGWPAVRSQPPAARCSRSCSAGRR